jgi:hypothetical protein
MGNREGQEKKKGRAQKPGPSVIPRHGARVALPQSPTLRADKNTILYIKELDTGQKLRHEKGDLTHYHYWKKQVLLRIPALYPLNTDHP